MPWGVGVRRLAAGAVQFEVVVFTASLDKYANPVLDLMERNAPRSVHFRLFREHCVLTNGALVKDITVSVFDDGSAPPPRSVPAPPCVRACRPAQGLAHQMRQVARRRRCVSSLVFPSASCLQLFVLATPLAPRKRAACMPAARHGLVWLLLVRSCARALVRWLLVVAAS